MPSTLTTCFSSYTGVPTPVCVKIPPRPNPPARIRSIKVPCGTSCTSSSPTIICRWVSGLRPIWLTMALRNNFAVTTFADPLAGRCCVVGDDGEVALILADDLVHHALRRPNCHEASDHEAYAIRDHGYSLFERDSLHVFSTPFIKQSVVVQRSRPPMPVQHLATARIAYAARSSVPHRSGSRKARRGCHGA